MKKLTYIATIFVAIIVWAAAPVWAARNSSGSYSLPYPPVVAGTPITKDWANGTLNDVASEITNSLDRGGRGPMLAPLRVVDGSVSASGVGFATEPGSGLYKIGAADWALAVNGSKKLELLPGSITASNDFNVSGAANITGALGVTGVSNLADRVNMTYAGTQLLDKGNGVLRVGTSAGNDLELYRGGTTRILIGGAATQFSGLDIWQSGGNIVLNKGATNQGLYKSGGGVAQFGTLDANEVDIVYNSSIVAAWDATRYYNGGRPIQNVQDPTNPQDATTKNYVDARVATPNAVVPNSGNTPPNAMTMIESATGLLTPVNGPPRLLDGFGKWQCHIPVFGVTAIPAQGSDSGYTLIGSSGVTASTWGTGSARARAPFVHITNTNSATAGWYETNPQLWRGNAAGLGGFVFTATWGFGQIDSTARVAVGLAAAPSTINSLNPQTRNDVVYFGCTAQPDMYICFDDNTGTATCNDLGANFPCFGQSNSIYTGSIWAAPGASTIQYSLTRLDAGPYNASGTLNTKLPRNTLQLGWQVLSYASSGTTTMDLFGVCTTWEN